MLTLNIFYHYLFSKRAGSLIRTIARICVLGVGVGMASLVIVMSVMSGFNHSIKSRLLLTKPHLSLQGEEIQLRAWKKYLATQKETSSYLVETQDVVVRTVEGTFSGAVAKGIEPEPLKDFFKRLSQHHVGENRQLEELVAAADLSENEVILGLGLARQLDIFEGDKIVLIPPESLLVPAGEIPYYAKAVVKAIVQTELHDVDSQAIYYRLGKGLRALGNARSKEHEVEVRLDDIGHLSQIKDELIQQGARVETWEDRNAALLFALKMEKILIATFIGLATLITGFSIITVLILLITQKRKDIGILMAIGLSKARSQRLFSHLGFVLAMMGICGGLGVGVVTCLVIDGMKMDFLPSIYYDTSIPVSIDIELILYSLFGGALVAYIGALLPVRLALRFTPSEAIRSRG